MKKLLFLLLISSVQIVFSQNKKLDKLLNEWNKSNIPYISAKELAQKKDTVVLLDSREQKEFNISHLKNATCVGFDKFSIEKTLQNLPEDKTTAIVVYCSLGIRSEKIAKKIKDKGYTNVYNLYGGIFEWKNNNFQVQDALGKPTEKVHAFNKSWGKWLKKGEKVY